MSGHLPSSSGVLCCGNLVRDIAVGPVTDPGWGRSTWVDFIEEGIGGNGANTAYTLAKLGTPARLIGTIGADDAGDRVLATLQSAGVDTRFVERSSLPTPSTVALVSPTGDRALLHRPGASGDVFKHNIVISAELTSGCSWFHLGNVFALPALRSRAAELMEQLRGSGLRISIDTGWDARGEWMRVLGPCLDGADLLFVNADEARELTGRTDPVEAARGLRQHGARTVVVKLGPAGSLVYSGGNATALPAFRVNVVDTTGAGDCFVGGFLAALQRGFDEIEAARFANAVGALSVQKLGGTAGLLGFDETLGWMANNV